MAALNANVNQGGRVMHARQTSMNVKLAVPVCMMVYVRIQTVAMSVAAKRSGMATTANSMSMNACSLRAKTPVCATIPSGGTCVCARQAGLAIDAP